MNAPAPTDSRPRRSLYDRLRRRLRTPLILLAVRTLSGLFALLPWRAAQAAGRALGRAVWAASGLVNGRDRRRALEHLAIAFPELPEAERTRIGQASHAHLGTVAAEILWLSTRHCRHLEAHVHTEGLDRARALRAAGRPIMLLSGHCGNWEMLGATSNCAGLEIAVVARALDEPSLHRVLVAARRRFGTRIVDRGKPGAARELLRALRRGGLGMLIDQDTAVDGAWVPFFGRPAYTPVAAARLALRRNVAVLPSFIERLPDGSHLARVGEPLDLPDDEVEATAVMTHAIEEQIRRVPEQWVWMHRRWRRRPPPSASD